MKKWESSFIVAKIPRQIDWGPDHPCTGNWQESWTVLNKQTGEPVTKRFYSMEEDAKRGAAQIYNSIEKKLLG